MNHQFSSLLRNLQCPNRYEQFVVLKNLASSIQNANKSDLQELLELLNTTHDTELQVKLFSVLAACLLSKNANCEIIITCKALYDRLQDALDRGLPLRTTNTLNFILALLSFEAEDDETSKKLAVCARNFIRVSGCLTTMSSLLTSGMMYQDTWIALCQSFAEACRGSALNQSYCSHLVPFCVQRCLQGDVEVFCVLQNLLHNHERNIQLFLEINGISIFTRESLQHDTCMQLLNTIVQKSAQAISLLRKTSVPQDLHHFLRLCGPHSQIGQWSTIILYHLDSEINKSNKHLEQEVPIPDSAVKTESIHQKKVNKVSHNVSIRPEFDETRHLFQNVIKEVLQWKSQNNNFKVPLIPDIYKKDNLKRSHSHSLQRGDMMSFGNNHQNRHKSKRIENEKVFQNDFVPYLQKQEKSKSDSKELSFSFLFKQNFRQMNLNSHNDLEAGGYFSKCGLKNNQSVINNYSSNITNASKIENTDANPRKDTSGFYQKAEWRADKNQSEIDLIEFKPIFMSTPKRQIEKNNLTKSKYRIDNKKVDKINKQKRKKSPLVEKPKQQRSMSARLFSAINESCITIVKNVKSIFKTKENANSQLENTSSNTETSQHVNVSCSHSFTDYMRKRDAILASNCTRTDYDDFSIDMKKNSCNTCSDTIILRSKLNHNVHLKKTLTKLKMGINLYGCDFKKISKVMWPRERYMTAKVLNNLYRKLIVKH